MSERASKGRFLKPDKLKTYSNEGKGKKKKKERGEGKEEKRKKSNDCAVSFCNGYFGDFAFSKIRLDMFTNLPTFVFKFCF